LTATPRLCGQFARAFVTVVVIGVEPVRGVRSRGIQVGLRRARLGLSRQDRKRHQEQARTNARS
jgi:hypothetical protein